MRFQFLQVMARELHMITVMKMILRMAGEMVFSVLGEIRNLKSLLGLEVGSIKKTKTLRPSLERKHLMISVRSRGIR